MTYRLCSNSKVYKLILVGEPQLSIANLHAYMVLSVNCLSCLFYKGLAVPLSPLTPSKDIPAS